MNIRKYWNKIILVVAAFFWAGCGDENSVQVQKVVDTSSTQQPEGFVDSSSDFVEESSSSNSKENCKDTEKYPLVVANSDIRCANKIEAGVGDPPLKLQLYVYPCCDGTEAQAANLYQLCSSEEEHSPYVPDSVPGFLFNDTLYTRQEYRDHKAEQKKREEEEHEAGIIDSLNRNSTYCDDHGGIKSRITFTRGSYSYVDEYECNGIRDSALVEYCYSKLEDSSVDGEKIWDCRWNIVSVSEFAYLFNESVPLYGNPPSYAGCAVEIPETDKLNKYFECIDGTKETSEEYIAEMNAKHEEEVKCGVLSPEIIEFMENCSKDSSEADLASSSSLFSSSDTESSSSVDESNADDSSSSEANPNSSENEI